MNETLREAALLLNAVGPPRSKRARAIDGEYERWQTEGDDFATLCWAIEVLAVAALPDVSDRPPVCKT